MPEQHVIDEQLTLLDTYRTTLNHLIVQAARFGGEAMAPTQVMHDLRDARQAIQRIKVTLRRWGQTIEDLPEEAISKSVTSDTRRIAPDLEPDLFALPRQRERVIPRAEYNRAYRFLADEDGPRTVILYGRPGVGKTTISTVLGNDLYQQGIVDTVFQRRFLTTDAPEMRFHDYIRYLSLKLGINHGDDISLQTSLIHRALRPHRILLILDNLGNDINDDFRSFIEHLPAKTKTLITQEERPRFGNGQPIEVAPFTRKEDIAAFLKLYCPDVTFTGEQLDILATESEGNTFTLDRIAREINASDIDTTIRKLREMLGEPGNDIAEKLIGGTLRKLPPSALLLLQAHSIFEATAHEQALIAMASRDPANTESAAALRQWIKTFVSEKIMYEMDTPGRYRLHHHYQRYLHRELERRGQTDLWWRRLAYYYRELSKRSTFWDDEAGWTIYTDYVDVESSQHNVAHDDEAAMIVDVIDFCLSPEQASQIWDEAEQRPGWSIAAELIDDFRALLFAAGYWNQRITFCERVGEYARAEHEWHVVGQFQRLLAWMYCFQGKYERSRELIEEAHDVSCKYMVRSSPSDTSRIAKPETVRIVHSQTYYKALNTFGQIALRNGNQEAIHGQVAGRSKRSAQARQHIAAATRLFAQARSHFDQARRYVQAVYPPETLIIEFHLAEVQYYDRHALDMSGKDQSKPTHAKRMHLDNVRKEFERLLREARARNHKRLTAHCMYYLGKTNRRLAALLEPGRAANQYYTTSRDYLTNARLLANKHGDRVLSARVEFALGQWCASQIDWKRMAVEDRRLLENARELVKAAHEAFRKQWQMTLEGEDTKAFLKQRLLVSDEEIEQG